MSLALHHAAKAITEGLVHTSGFGLSVADTSHYRQVMQAGQIRRQRRDAILHGRVPSMRVDAASTDPRLDAEEQAAKWEWAEYLSRRFASYGRKVTDHMDGGLNFARSYRTQVSGKVNTAWRTDATVPMASQGLMYILPEVYRIQHNDLPCWNGDMLKIWNGADPAAQNVVWYEMDNAGLARAASTYDRSAIQMVNGPLASDNVISIIPALVGMETNFMDPRREALAASMGKPDFQIEVMKREACERTIAEFFDNLWFGGDATLGIDGLMNNPIVQTLEITGGTWASKTALQIFNDLKTMIWAISNRTAGALGDLGKITIKLPSNQYQLLMQPITAAGSQSILAYTLEFFQKEGRGTPTITFEYRLDAANSYAYNGGPNILDEDTAVILYQDNDTNKDPVFVLTQPIEVPAPVATTGLGDITYYHARGGGMKLPDARRIIYAVGM
jgi:hypothetical protein